jgi:predicted glycosyltransferase
MPLNKIRSAIMSDNPKTAVRDIGSVPIKHVVAPDSCDPGHRNGSARSSQPKSIWIDLDNSPHVPFFAPIIDEIEKRGYKIILTARDSYQVCELLKLHGISCKVIGGHWGKSRALKVIGTFLRAIQLLPLIMREKPDVAVSHGSRAQFLTSLVLGIPNVAIFDYEFTAGFGPMNPDWIIMPDLLPDSAGGVAKNRIAKYPGLKEDVYVPRLRPDPSVRAHLGLSDSDIVAVVRPPATEAHYHNPESEMLFDATLDFLTRQPRVRVVLLPRNEKQAQVLRGSWRQWIDEAKIIIPENAVNGLNLIWASDLVISGGGTMNREAAALGVPVYSIFRGRIGAVDQYLASTGRMVLLESVEDVQTKVVLKRRRCEDWGSTEHHNDVLPCIVEGIISVVENQRFPVHS